MPVTAGDIFGRLRVLGHAGRGRKGHQLWLCRCECGNEKVVFATALSQGKTKSCGCLMSDKAKATERAAVGSRLGGLTVVEVVSRDSKSLMVRCLCQCGSEAIVNYFDLKSKGGATCGCFHWARTHDMSGTPEYMAWGHMINRCHNPSDKSWGDYGARGVAVCEEWRGPGGFERFYQCIGKRPTKNHSLDRYPNNNGNYEPGNVRWATRAQQGRNKRSNRLVTFNGHEMCVSEFAEQIGLPRWKVYQWIQRDGLSVEQIVAKLQASALQ